MVEKGKSKIEATKYSNKYTSLMAERGKIKNWE